MNERKFYNAIRTADVYGNLRVGIINQAIADYKGALQIGDKGKAYALERWFLSEWGEQLSGNNGAYIIEQVRKEIAKWKTKKQ